MKLKIVVDYILYIFKHIAVLETTGLMDVNIIMTILFYLLHTITQNARLLFTVRVKFSRLT